MKNPIDIAVARLIAVFGEPRTADPELYVAEFRKALKGIDPHVLELAVDQWMRKDTAFWPRPGELLAEVQTASAKIYARKPAEHAPLEDRPVLDAAARARVEKLVAETISAMGDDGRIAGEATPTQWDRGHRAAFAAMQAQSPNVHLHAKGLSPISKRMTGDRDDR